MNIEQRNTECRPGSKIQYSVFNIPLFVIQYSLLRVVLFAGTEGIVDSVRFQIEIGNNKAVES